MRLHRSARALGVFAPLLAAAPAFAAIDNALSNPGFEDTTLSPFYSYPGVPSTFCLPLTDPAQAHSGSSLAAGDIVPASQTQSLIQSFAPIDTATITETAFWYRKTDLTEGNPTTYMYWMEQAGGHTGPAFMPFDIIPDGLWHKQSYASPGVGAAYISFGVLASNLTGAPIHGLQFDDFLVTSSPLPEPASAATFLALSSLAALRRRR